MPMIPLGGKRILTPVLGRSWQRAAAGYTNFFTSLYTGSRNNFAGTVGFQFTTTGAITVVALGRSISGSITQNHRVGIWNTSGDLQGFVTVNGSSPVDALGYAYELCTPINLASGQTYHAGSEEFSGGDLWADLGSIPNHLATANILKGVYRSAGGWGFPNQVIGSANQGYVPPTWFT